MSLLRVALPALAAAGSAYAACSHTATSTIQNGGDATAVATCKTFSGSLAVATGLSDDISLDGVKKIDGDLIIKSNSGIRRFGGSDLEEVTGQLAFDNVAELAGLSFPKLTAVGNLFLNGLPNLRSLEFTTGISKADGIRIENTKLQNLDGIDLEDEVDTIFIANNNEIDTIVMKSIVNITEYITLSFNNPEVNVSFPELESANNISFRAIGSLDIPSLAKINKGDFGVFESNLSIIAAPNLTKIDGALVINNNDGLKNISLNALTDVGANLQIANNTNLRKIDGLAKLKNVEAALDMSGNFTEVETPSLEYVKGVFNLQSEGDIGSVCKDFYDPLKNKQKLPKGKYVCEGKLEKANTAGNAPGSSSGSSGSGSGSSNGDEGAAVGLTVPSISLGLVGLIAVMLL